MFLYTQKRIYTSLWSGICASCETLHEAQDDLHMMQEIAPNATLGEHTTTYVVIVCYSYTLCRPSERYIWTSVHWHIGTFGLMCIGTLVSPLFPLLSYRWGTLLLCKAEGNKPRRKSVARGGRAPLKTLSRGGGNSPFPCRSLDKLA